MLVVLLSLSFFHETRSGMPLASTCSAAISAACHPPPADNEAHLLPVQWGHIPGRVFGMAEVKDEDVASDHCAFTTMVPLSAPDGLRVLGGDEWVVARRIQRGRRVLSRGFRRILRLQRSRLPSYQQDSRPDGDSSGQQRRVSSTVAADAAPDVLNATDKTLSDHRQVTVPKLPGKGVSESSP